MNFCVCPVDESGFLNLTSGNSNPASSPPRPKRNVALFDDRRMCTRVVCVHVVVVVDDRLATVPRRFR